MTNRTAALRYARALFDVAVKEGADLGVVERELETFAGLFTGTQTLARVLLNPAVPSPRKQAAVAEVAARAGASPIVSKLVVLLAERDRLAILPDLLAAYRERMLDHQKVIRADVVTASALQPGQVEAIKESLSKATGRTVTMSARVDPSIVGGLVARVGSTVYDGSVTTQLRRMKQRLAERI